MTKRWISILTHPIKIEEKRPICKKANKWNEKKCKRRNIIKIRRRRKIEIKITT